MRSKGRTAPPRNDACPIVTIIHDMDSSFVCVYIGSKLFGSGEVDGFFLGDLLERAGCHVHYLNTFEHVYTFDGTWPATLIDALRLPVLWEKGDGWTEEDPIQTLASINVHGLKPYGGDT